MGEVKQFGTPPELEERREQYLGKPLPSSEESERVILGAILLDNDVITQAVGRVGVEDFYSPLHKRIYACMVALFDQLKPIDPILIGEELKKEGSLDAIGGIATITNLTFGLPRNLNIGDYVGVVKDKATLRSLIRACGVIQGHALSEEEGAREVLEGAEAAIYELRSRGVLAETSIHLGEEVGRSILGARDRLAAGTSMIGVPLGFAEIDKRLQGARPGQQIVVAARPSVGKTALAVRVGYNTAVKSGVPTLLVELEMSREEIADRIICAECNIDSYLLRSGYLSEEQWKGTEEIWRNLSTADGPFFILDSPFTTVRTIRTELRRINTEQMKKGKPKVGLVIVDHIGLMRNETEKKGRNREGEVSEISRDLKQIAREFGLATMPLSQLNRMSENRTDHRPTLADLRESGAIEQDADVVMMIFREDMYQKDIAQHTNMAEVIIAKNRNGPTGIARLHFARKSARFADLAHVVENPGLNDNSNEVIL